MRPATATQTEKQRPAQRPGWRQEPRQRGLQPGRQEGGFERDRYRWQLDVVPFADPLAARAQRDPGAPQLLDVRLQVRWGDGRGQALQWRTLRLAPHDINQAASP